MYYDLGKLSHIHICCVITFSLIGQSWRHFPIGIVLYYIMATRPSYWSSGSMKFCNIELRIDFIDWLTTSLSSVYCVTKSIQNELPVCRSHVFSRCNNSAAFFVVVAVNLSVFHRFAENRNDKISTDNEKMIKTYDEIPVWR